MENRSGFAFGFDDMKTTRKNYGPGTMRRRNLPKYSGRFTVVTREIRVQLKDRMATLTCNVQSGITPLGRSYRYGPEWWIKLDGAPTASGPWTADAIRNLHAA